MVAALVETYLRLEILKIQRSTTKQPATGKMQEAMSDVVDLNLESALLFATLELKQ